MQAEVEALKKKVKQLEDELQNDDLKVSGYSHLLVFRVSDEPYTRGCSFGIVCQNIIYI